MKYWYLASPYSKYKDGIEAAFTEICKQSGLLIKSGVPVYCPIAHTHPIAINSGMDPYDHEIWLKVDQPLIDSSYGMIVCMMDGWDQSYGINHEIEEFTKAKKTIIYMEPGKVPEEILEEIGKY